MIGIDFSFARIAGADIKAQGYDFVCRYLASADAKRITVAEVADFQANNLGIVLVWEDAPDAALGGFNAGVIDAREALNQAGAISWPSDLPIYFAVDFDATEAEQTQIDDYLRGVASVIGLPRVGVYGGFYVVSRCLDHGTATFGWQTTAWSGGQVDPRVSIYQNGQSAFSGNADIDEARTTNFGQWGTNHMNQDQATALSLYMRLIAFEDVDQANSHSADDVQHMLADPGYAAAVAEQLYKGEWQSFAWKATHYDEVAKQLADLQVQQPTPPIPAPPLPNLVNNVPPIVPPVVVGNIKPLTFWQKLNKWLFG